MHYIFNKTCIGYLHLRNNKPCQDYSSSYKDNERMIITCSDGHGGNIYIRSEVGAKLASIAVNNVFSSIDNHFFAKSNNESMEDKIKLLVLCEFDKLVEREIGNKPIRKSELEGLDEEEIDVLRFNPSKAYGTTLTGAMVYKNKIIAISIGDSECLGIRKGELVKIFDNSNDPAGNITYSMCQEDAYKYLRVTIINSKELDGIFLCSDGLSSPYQSYMNFTSSYLKPLVRNVLKLNSLNEVDKGIDKIALELGVGDDVSLSFILNEKTNIKYYS